MYLDALCREVIILLLFLSYKQNEVVSDSGKKRRLGS